MKIWTLLNHVDLSQAVKQSEFLFQESRIKADGIAKKILEKFPTVPDLYTEHPALAADNKNGQYVQKFPINLTFLDKEMLMRSYRQAVKDSTEDRVEMRDKNFRKDQKIGDQRAILRESDSQELRIMQTWAKRFHMEKIFHELRIKSLDDFKKVMMGFKKLADERATRQYQQFQKQSGLDPSAPPTPIEWIRISGKDEEISRTKMELQLNNVINLEDAKRHLLQLQGHKMIEKVHELGLPNKKPA